MRSAARTVRGLRKRRFGTALRSPQLANLTLLTLAALHGGSRQPAALARRLETQVAFHHNEKRVHRFVGNPRLPTRLLFDRLLGMILALGPKGTLVPVAGVDETDLPGGCQGLVAAIPYLGRALAFRIYRYDSMPAREAQDRYRLRMRSEEDFRDLKTTLGRKRLRPRKDARQRVGCLLLVAMVTTCVAAYLYPRAVAEQQRVVRRQSDVSFVRLVVIVYRLRWSRYVSGAGRESGPR